MRKPIEKSENMPENKHPCERLSQIWHDMCEGNTNDGLSVFVV